MATEPQKAMLQLSTATVIFTDLIYFLFGALIKAILDFTSRVPLSLQESASDDDP